MKNVHCHIFNVQKKLLINLSLVGKYVLPFYCKRIIIIIIFYYYYYYELMAYRSASCRSRLSAE